MSYPLPEHGIAALLADLAERKEFRIGETSSGTRGSAPSPRGFLPATSTSSLRMPGLRLVGAQTFIRGFENPNTPYSRLLIKWQTGTGKSIAAITIAQEFVKYFREAERLAAGVVPSVYIISFTARETILEDMLRHPEFGFASAAEIDELRRQRAAAASAGPGTAEFRQMAGYLGVLRRRITDRTRGGYYQFYGYKEFANRLFTVTPRGAAAGLDVQALRRESETENGQPFGALLAVACKRGELRIDEELLAALKHSLLIADEIHEAYNMLEENNYGIAIQYVLDALGDEAPRLVLISATPTTGSAAEIVDLLNLLVPRSELPGGTSLHRDEFFYGSPRPGETTRLRPSALERIRTLAAGRVSFLLDADLGAYPRRVFVGEPAPGVPYLRLTPCPMSPFHERTLAHAAGDTSTPTLNDMAFPNPEFAPDAAMTDGEPASYGLYRSDDAAARLQQAPAEWQAEAGVLVRRGSEASLPSGVALIGGDFLGRERLGAYASKLDRCVHDIIEAIKAGPGKILVFHPRVRMSGVLIVQEALRASGIADEGSMPSDRTLCAICGIARGQHSGAAHAYTPARFTVAHSLIDRTTMTRNISHFNSPANLEGHQIRILIGSKIIRQSLNFRAVRHEMILAMPTDYPTLIQIFGRVVRKDSHSELPSDQRDVKITIYVSTHSSGALSAEMQRYIDKGREFAENIQPVERVLHECAVDGYANWDRIRAALGWQNGAFDSLDALAYTPMVTGAPATIHTATFNAYGYGEREIATMVSMCRVLFRARPVWTYDDLWAELHAGTVQSVNYNTALFDEGNFSIALERLERPIGDTMVARVGKYYILARIGPGGRPLLDAESYLRDFATKTITAAGPTRVKIADYLRDTMSGRNFAVRLAEYERRYLAPGAPLTPELTLLDYGAEFHYELLRRLIAGSTAVTSDDGRVMDVYRRFHVAVTAAEATKAKMTIVPERRKRTDLVGYATPDSVVVYTEGRWQNVATSAFKFGRRVEENNIVVGFVVSTGAETHAKFKVRPPLHKMDTSGGDIRLLERGGVCETRPRAELDKFVRALRAEVARAATRGGAPDDNSADGDNGGDDDDAHCCGGEDDAHCCGGEDTHSGYVAEVCEPLNGGGEDDGDDCPCRHRTATVGGNDCKCGDDCKCGADCQCGDNCKCGTRQGGADERDRAPPLQPTVVENESWSPEDTPAELSLGYETLFDRASRKRFPSATLTCEAIRLQLLALEEKSRAQSMENSIRWLYLFNERAPSVTTLSS